MDKNLVANGKLKIKELLNAGLLTVRAYHVCENNGMLTLKGIAGYYLKYKNFQKLSKAGRKTDQELTALVMRYFQNQKQSENQDKKIISRYPRRHQLSEYQIAYLDLQLQKYFSKLSVRAQNCLKAYFNSDIKFIKFYDNFLKDKIQVEINLHGSGVKTNKELKAFIGKINKIYEDAIEMNANEASFNEFGTWLDCHFRVSASDLRSYKVQSESGFLLFFRLLYKLLAKGKLIPIRRSKIFVARSKYLKHSHPVPIENLGDSLGLSGERVRQLIIETDDKMDGILYEFSKFTQYICTKTDYLWNYQADIIPVVIKEVEEINVKERVRFQPEFMVKIVKLLTLETHRTIWFSGNGNVAFIIRKELVKGFDYLGFISGFEQFINGLTTQTEKLNLNELILPFFVDKQKFFKSRVLKSCRILIVRLYSNRIAMSS
ncbi:MAG: hypothetical protein IPM34_04790 [Saprospiraceae bacterium]|nr:hypothetical protein [Saprospiraceae bacterium]